MFVLNLILEVLVGRISHVFGHARPTLAYCLIQFIEHFLNFGVQSLVMLAFVFVDFVRNSSNEYQEFGVVHVAEFV